MILEKEYATEGSPATAGNTTLSKRYWGLDLSGSTQSTGGVGGLLATIATKSSPATAGTETHYYHYDANGNVTDTIDANGDLTASYEYGPFGELVSESGSYVSENTYKFSTKPQDTETGYYYYGYRYYDSVNGRWLNRDPIMERGGINIYGFVHNNAIHNVDIKGEIVWAAVAIAASTIAGLTAMYCAQKAAEEEAECANETSNAQSECDPKCETFVPSHKAVGCGLSAKSVPCGGKCKKK